MTPRKCTHSHVFFNVTKSHYVFPWCGITQYCTVYLYFFHFSIKTEFATVQNPYVKMYSSGFVYMYESLTLTSACKMDLINFPFDVQICTMTIHSPMHSSTSESQISMSAFSILWHSFHSHVVIFSLRWWAYARYNVWFFVPDVQLPEGFSNSGRMGTA